MTRTVTTYRLGKNHNSQYCALERHSLVRLQLDIAVVLCVALRSLRGEYPCDRNLYEKRHGNVALGNDKLKVF